MKKTGRERRLIAVIDDDLDLLFVLGLLLTRCGFDVEVSDRPLPHDALAKLRPATIFLDLALRGCSGGDYCSALKADAAFADVPIVLISGRSEAELRLIATHCGADASLTKPFDLDALLRLARA